ncbi:MAG: hypothetical protein CL878_02645 [Dehalococcoidia bacterium]|nr:hypothetical protein [Dehalococcoidia bacterium]
MPRYPRSPSNLALCRLLSALPDLHRLRPYWHELRHARAALLRQRPGCSVGDNVTLHEGFFFTSSLRLHLHDGCEIRDHVRLGIDEPVAGATSFELGAGSVVLSDCHFDCSAPTRIGAAVHIGRRTQIYTHAHDTARRAVPVLEAPIQTAPVTIEDDVMLYSDVVVLPGVTIGRGAVVAVRAVVTRDVAPYQVVGGIPAQSIGERE